MSDHYDYVFTCAFSPTAPVQVLDTLAYMTRTQDYRFDNPPDHPFFVSEDVGDVQPYERWRQALRPGELATAGYLATFTQCGTAASRFAQGHYVLSFRIAVHDDEAGHYDGFIEWLASHSDTEGFVGYAYGWYGGGLTLWAFQAGRAYPTDDEAFTPL